MSLAGNSVKEVDSALVYSSVLVDSDRSAEFPTSDYTAVLVVMLVTELFQSAVWEQVAPGYNFLMEKRGFSAAFPNYYHIYTLAVMVMMRASL